jgi:drug/metabolite transporter (DMT)-like permease
MFNRYLAIIRSILYAIFILCFFKSLVTDNTSVTTYVKEAYLFVTLFLSFYIFYVLNYDLFSS